MINVDTRRMKRVLDRLYAPEGSPPPGGPPEEDPGNMEDQLQDALKRTFRRCSECRRALSLVLRRSEKRSTGLRTERFISGQPGIGDNRSPDRGEGTLSLLRRACRLLDSLSEEYSRNPAQPGWKGRAEEYARECRRDADTVRSLLSRLMR